MTPRIVFMGTPEFARAALDALLAASFSVVGVVCQPDKPKNRGHKMVAPPVKERALECGIPVLQPERLKDNEDFRAELEALSPDLIVVAAYGRILPPYIIHGPRYGCINVHGSLLPRWRGAAPIQRAIMAGDREIGVTIMQMDDGLDTGAMLRSASFPLGENDTYGTVHDRLAALGGSLLCEVLPSVFDGTAAPCPQPEEGTCYAAKIEKEECRIDFSRPVREIQQKVMALSPAPAAAAAVGGSGLKIVSSVILSEQGSGHGHVGEVESLKDGVIAVRCGEGLIGITEVIPEGRGRMRALDYINGRRIAVGDRLD